MRGLLNETCHFRGEIKKNKDPKEVKLSVHPQKSNATPFKIRALRHG